MYFATPQQLAKMRDSLKSDHKQVVLTMDVDGLTMCFVSVCEVLSSTPLSDKDGERMMNTARLLADALEDKRPDVEPYIAMMFGLIALHGKNRG